MANTRPVVYDYRGNPIATSLTKHLKRGAPLTRRTRGDRIAAWAVVVCAAVLAVQILPTLVAEVWR